MSAGSDAMQSILYNDAGVQAAIDSWVYSATTYYMVFSGLLLPEFITTDSGRNELTVQNKTINHFAIDTESGAKPVIDINRQVSCRAYTQSDAETIRDAAFTALNRVKSSDGSVNFVASKLPVIPPQDKADNWNAPLNVRTMTVRN